MQVHENQEYQYMILSIEAILWDDLRHLYQIWRQLYYKQVYTTNLNIWHEVRLISFSFHKVLLIRFTKEPLIIYDKILILT